MPLTYTLTSVPGLNFNADTRTLSGTPSTPDTFDLTYTVTDANDASTTATFTIIVSDGLALDTPATRITQRTRRSPLWNCRKRTAAPGR